MIEFHRRLPPVTGRADGLALPARVALGTAGLSVAKILENMEIGHNVLHGQWDWMNDPNIHSSTWDWDTASPAVGLEALAQLRAPHVHQRHRQGPDVGYEIMRIDPRQPWHPVYLLAAALQPAADGSVRVGRRRPRPRLRGDPQGHEAQGAAARRAARDRPEGAPPDGQGLRRLPAAQRPALEEDPDGQPHRERRPQRVVARDHLLRPLPRPGVHVHRGGGRGRDARRAGTSASCSARPTSRAARPST